MAVTKETREALRQLVIHIVEEIVDHETDVEVNIVPATSRLVVELHTNPNDVGQVVGRDGAVVTGIRAILSAFAGKNRIGVDFDYVTDQEKRASSSWRKAGG